MIIGNFKYYVRRDIYVGEIRTLALHRSRVEIRRVNKTTGKEPDYILVEDTPMGEFDLGVAWERKQRGGVDFLSVQLCDPVLGITVDAKLSRVCEDIAELVCDPPKAKAKTR